MHEWVSEYVIFLFVFKCVYVCVFVIVPMYIHTNGCQTIKKIEIHFFFCKYSKGLQGSNMCLYSLKKNTVIHFFDGEHNVFYIVFMVYSNYFLLPDIFVSVE